MLTERHGERERERSGLTGASEGQAPRLSSVLLNPYEGVGSVSELVFEEGWGGGGLLRDTITPLLHPSFTLFLFSSGLSLFFFHLTQVKQLDRNQDQSHCCYRVS